MDALPFRPGDQVISRQAPQRGSWTVTKCEPHPKGGFTLWFRSGGADGIDAAERYMLCPEGWEEPPYRPTPQGLRGQRDLSAPVSVDEFQIELQTCYSAYARWCEKHLVPLGFKDEAARARKLAGPELELVPEAAQ